MMTASVTSLQRVEFSSTDPDETREFLDKTYGWRMAGQRPGEPGRPLTVSMAGVGAVGSAFAAAPGDISYQVAGDDYVVIDTLLHGTFQLEHADHVDRYGPGDLFIANHPGADFISSTHGIRVLTTIVSSALLSEVAGGDPDRVGPHVRFLSYTPAREDGRLWRAAGQYLDDLLNDPGPELHLDAAPLLLAVAARQVAAAALVTFPNTAVTEPGRPDSTDAHSDTLRHAIAFVESRPDADITLTDLARAARVTPRAVQMAFRRHLNTTPLAYLRRVRLDRAHADLQAATPGDGTTVAAVAARWGFTASRFSAAYRAAYGCSPSHTLHR